MRWSLVIRGETTEPPKKREYSFRFNVIEETNVVPHCGNKKLDFSGGVRCGGGIERTRNGEERKTLRRINEGERAAEKRGSNSISLLF